MRPTTEFDAVVVGAGPAGSVAAHGLAGANRRVLLVDREDFPRYKVCGGCLNRASLSILEATGVRSRLEAMGARPFSRLRVSAYGGSMTINLPPGLSVSREVLDLCLVEEATRAGAELLTGAVATLAGTSESGCRVRLRPRSGREWTVTSSIVLCADGLGGGFLGKSPFPSKPSKGSRIGLGVQVEDASLAAFPSDTIQMWVGRSGYVGAARIEQGRLNLAAAVDPAALQDTSPSGLLGAIVREADSALTFPLPDHVKGTPRLTRRRGRVAHERIFVIGDSAGYVEPFTGEGIAWAMTGGRLILPIAQQAIERWDPAYCRQWSACYGRFIRRRQVACRLLSGTLKSPLLSRLAIRLTALHSTCFPLAARAIGRPLEGSRRL